MENINGYITTQPFGTVGAGTASWTIARKNGKEYFLKRFNTPKYVPSCIEFCQQYEEKKSKLYQAIASANNGNLVVIDEFFRHETYYYIATQCVHESSITAEQAYKLPKDKLLIIMKTLVHSMMQLERLGIVHADLKPSNVMLKPTVGGFYSLKLIDFDSSFFVSDPPTDREDLEGDTTFLSPEVLMGMCGAEVELTCKIDVFATGIMFHLFLSNALPGFDSEYDSVCEAVANNAEIRISPSIPPYMKTLIQAMLDVDPNKRPSFEDIFRYLSRIGEHAESAAPEVVVTRPAPIPTVRKSSNVPSNPWMKKAGKL